MPIQATNCNKVSSRNDRESQNTSPQATQFGGLFVFQRAIKLIIMHSYLTYNLHETNSRLNVLLSIKAQYHYGCICMALV